MYEKTYAEPICAHLGGGDAADRVRCADYSAGAIFSAGVIADIHIGDTPGRIAIAISRRSKDSISYHKYASARSRRRSRTRADHAASNQRIGHAAGPKFRLLLRVRVMSGHTRAEYLRRYADARFD